MAGEPYPQHVVPPIKTIRLPIGPAGAVIAAVAAAYGLRPGALIADRRDQEVVIARHLAMWLCRELYGMTYPHIARIFHRDHTTVLYACRKIAAQQPGAPEIVWSRLASGISFRSKKDARTVPPSPPSIEVSASSSSRPMSAKHGS